MSWTQIQEYIRRKRDEILMRRRAEELADKMEKSLRTYYIELFTKLMWVLRVKNGVTAWGYLIGKSYMSTQVSESLPDTEDFMVDVSDEGWRSVQDSIYTDITEEIHTIFDDYYKTSHYCYDLWNGGF